MNAFDLIPGAWLMEFEEGWYALPRRRTSVGTVRREDRRSTRRFEGLVTLASWRRYTPSIMNLIRVFPSSATADPNRARLGNGPSLAADHLVVRIEPQLNDLKGHLTLPALLELERERWRKNTIDP